MDRRDRSIRGEDRYRKSKSKENPSFSSTLLDAMYRSIDDCNGGSKGEDDLIFYRETSTRKNKHTAVSKEEAYVLEKYWMEKKFMSEKVVVRRKSAADLRRNSNSCSSSSDSSCGGGGGFSSTEAEWMQRRPKPIRTSVSTDEKFHRNEFYSQKPKHEGNDSGGFVKTKSRALKIYRDLKKVKQPISPGGRLASFLNSLFSAGNAKKAKISSSSSFHYEDEKKSKSAHASTTTCSSASSFSRSCLSKTPSTRGGAAKRSVRFYPVSVIVDEDCRPCGHKILYEDQPIFSKENARDFDMKDDNRFHHDDEDEDDDAASYSSSDLFELDNLGVFGIDRYCQELPVYETTHLDTNQAIANGLIV